MKTSAIILAGGKSERMNFPKPFLLFNEKKNFLQQIIDEYIRFGSNEILLVFNHELLDNKWRKYSEHLPLCVTVVPNHFPDSGRFFSLKLGLSKLNNTSFCFVQDVDNPFVTEALLKLLFKNKNENGYSAPYHTSLSADGKTEVKSGGHPVLLSKKIIDFIKNTKQDNLNLKEVIQKFDKTPVEVSDKNILVNINTPFEYEKFFGRKYQAII